MLLKKSNFLLLLLWIPVSGFSAENEMPDPPSATGPRSRAEADVIWEAAETHFQAGEFTEAAPEYQRLVDRYPAHRSIQTAFSRLGQCYLEIQKPKAALRAFKGQLSRTSDPIAQIPIRLKIGDAHLMAKNFHEALLVAQEILKRKTKPATPFNLEVFAKMLNARALRGLRRFHEASLRTDEIRQAMATHGSTFQDLENPVRFLEVSMKLSQCSRLAESKKMDETQALQEIDRRGECLVEALDHSRGLKFEAGFESAPFLDESRQAIQEYGRVCNSPPQPVGIRTRRQIELYMKEMREAVFKTCNLWAKAMQRSIAAQPKKPWTDLLITIDSAFTLPADKT